jgi:hypothetical protein
MLGPTIKMVHSSLEEEQKMAARNTCVPFTVIWTAAEKCFNIARLTVRSYKQVVSF